MVDDSPFVNSGYTACRTHDGGFLIGGEIQPYDPPNGQPTHPYLVKLDSQATNYGTPFITNTETLRMDREYNTCS
ncbi:MAG: hypothetical protein IPN94_04185 [Sphingobacteriales bacterium]|nr:hypothetical protein [Sphingobacteriales bacterium]